MSETVNLDSLDGFAFERVCERIFEKAGWGEVMRMGGTADGGRDLIIHTPEGKRIVVECKLYGNKSVGRPVVQKLHSAVINSDADRGMIVTTGKFSKAAIEYASGLTRKHDRPIDLFDMHKITELAHKAGIKLETGRMQKIYTYPIPERRVVVAALRSNINKLDSHPEPAADLMHLADMRASLSAMYFVSMSIRQTFSTSVGVIHETDVRDEHHMFDGSTGALDESGGGDFFGNPSVDASGLPEDYDRTSFMLDDVTLRERITQEMIDMHTEHVSYRGKNNVTYTKKCVPSARNVQINNLRQVYVPRCDITLKALDQDHTCDMEYNGTKTRLLDPTWSQCYECGSKGALLCNECGRVAHTSWVMSHGHRCRECGKTVCALCVWNTRRLLFFNNRFCSDCRPDNAKRIAG